MQDSAYSPLKVFHHRDKIEQLKEGKQIIPSQVQIFPSDYCQHSCLGCAYRTPGYTTSEWFPEVEDDGLNYNPKRIISYEKLIEILDDCVQMGVKAIHISGGGEPTTHPKIKHFFQAILERNLEFALVTNGVLLHKFFDELIEAKWVRISIDAGSHLTYAKERQVSPEGYYRVWDQIQELVKLKNHYNKDQLIIGIGFVVTKGNWKEIVDCAEKAQKEGVDNLRISGLFQSDNEKYFEDFYDDAADLCRKAKKLETDKFKVFNMFGDRIEDLKQHSPDYSFCGYQQFGTLIGGDQKVYRCCTTAYNSKGYIGSIKNQRFKDLWFSKEKQRNFDRFDARECERCMFHQKNKVILYMMSSNPRHVNFV